MKAERHTSYRRYNKRNFFYKAKPWLIAAGAFILAAAIAFGICYYVALRDDEEVYSEVMAESSLPTLTMEYNGRQINKLFGYTAEMDPFYIRDSVYVLDDSYEVPVSVTLYGNEAESVSYRLCDTVSESLLQEDTAGSLSSDGATLTASVVLDESISNDTEYVLDIILTLSSGETVHYYTRLIRSPGNYVAEQIELACEYNTAVLNKDEDFLSSYMNTNPWTQRNNNFSGVNLKSSLAQMMWQEMNVSLAGDVDITVTDVNGVIGCYILEYTVSRTDGDTTEYYRVSEYYRIRLNATYSRILSYERTVDQVFIPTSELLSTSSAELGVMSTDELETMGSSNGNYSCFVVGGSLWCMDSDSKTLTRIFSFENDDVTDERASFSDHDIKILSISDEGDIEFIVYGYMNAGLHEGLCGVGMYTYSGESGQVSENIFIQSDVTYEILKETAGGFVYLNDADELYILIDQSVYKICTDTQETEILATGLEEGSYKVSIDGSIIAWQNEGHINNASSITVLNAKSSESFDIEAEAGTSVKVLGFIGEDVVYGSGVEGNYYTDESDDEYLLMDTVYVAGSDGTIESENPSSSDYYISAVYEYNRIIITKNSGEEFTLFSSEISDVDTPTVSSEYDDIRETIYYISFIDRTTSAGEFTIDTETAAVLYDIVLTGMSGLIDTSDRYFVYGKGQLLSITSSAAEAISDAYDNEGYVISGDRQYFYRRGLIPTGVSFTDSNTESSVSGYEAGEIINVTGITLTEALYFTGENIAVFWIYDGLEYIITGYDSAENIKLYNMATGETESRPSDDMEESFETTGSVYVLE